MVGQTISHYKITEKLGEGGMGVVYKAEDTSLGRTVALKFLAAHLLQDEEARKRFRREARAAAALHHPNVCPVYEIGEAEGRTFLAMAFIEGESLDQKIEQGPLKIADALDIAQQIATGLEAAHKKGIFHRDIKPENVIVNDDGHATIMDFGLAQLAEASRLTRDDTTLGTVAYMSPEQTEGSGTDHRTDIWSLGVVLYEMVTGQPPFKGDYDKAIMYSILNEQPEPITAVRTGVPMELERMVGKCLNKRAAERYQNAGDLIVDLNGLNQKLSTGSPRLSSTLPSSETAAKIYSKNRKLRRQLLIFQMLFATSLASAVFTLVPSNDSSDQDRPVRKFSFAPNVSPRIVGQIARAVISPNGRHIAFVSGEDPRRLWVRDLYSDEPRPLEGTEDVVAPFWSPDSQFIGFGNTFVGVPGGELKKIPVGGGPVTTLCRLPGSYGGGSWSPDGESIAFSAGAVSRIYEVPAMGGEPELIVEPEESYRDANLWTPHFLPMKSGKRVLLFGTIQKDTIFLHDLDSGEQKALIAGDQPFYSPTGHILYQPEYQITDEGLFAMPFSLETLEQTGNPFPIKDSSGQASVSVDGTLVFVRGFQHQQIVWKNRRGEIIGKISEPQRDLQYPSLSPEGWRLAVKGREKDIPKPDIWVYDLRRDLRTRLTFRPAQDSRPVWEPAGKRVTFTSSRAGNYDVFARSLDGGMEAEVLAATPLWEGPADWSVNGKILVMDVDHPQNGKDIRYLRRDSDNSEFEEITFLATAFAERNPKLSPDGRFIAYQSDESGRFEVFVKPFPQGPGKWLMSRDGGAVPRWRRDGRELYYVEEDTLVAVEVQTGDEFSVGKATKLFSEPSLQEGNYPNYDVSSDGKQFIVITDADTNSLRIHIVQNWYEEFRDREQD